MKVGIILGTHADRQIKTCVLCAVKLLGMLINERKLALSLKASSIKLGLV